MDDLQFYITKLGLPTALLSTLNSVQSDPVFSTALAMALAGDFKTAISISAPLQAALCLALLPSTHDKYKALGIDDEIFFDTMGDIKIWMDDYHCKTDTYGLCELGFLQHHFQLQLFRLGRLQFQPTVFCHHTTKLPLAFGAKVLNVHVPAGAMLDPLECQRSLATAPQFFARYFAQSFAAFVCDSWLLYPDNALFMDKNSNIVQFLQLFSHIKTINCPNQAYERIFGNPLNPPFIKALKQWLTHKPYNFQALPQRTSLQKKAAEHLKNGGRLGMGLGVILIKS